MFTKYCLYCEIEIEKPRNESKKDWKSRHKFCSKNCFDLFRTGKSDPKMSHPWNEETRKILQNINLGRKHTKETRIKMRDSQLRRVSEGRHNSYKGGITKINQKIRTSLEYKLWRESVFIRDNYTCIWCGKNNCILNADHIKPFAYFPELRFSIDNGRTLCVDCHKTTDTYGNKSKNYKQ
jgi:hypothetical protein